MYQVDDVEFIIFFFVYFYGKVEPLGVASGVGVVLKDQIVFALIGLF